MVKRINNTAKFLLDTGLLFEINRRVLHPFGLALEVVVEDKKVVLGKLWDCRKDPEGIIYTEETFKDGQDKFNKFMEEFGKEKIKTRENIMGFIEQDDGDWSPVKPPEEQ